MNVTTHESDEQIETYDVLLQVLFLAFADNARRLALEVVTGIAGEAALACSQLANVLLRGRIEQFPTNTVMTIYKYHITLFAI